MKSRYISTFTPEGIQALDDLAQHLDISIEQLLNKCGAIGASMLEVEKRLDLSIIFRDIHGTEWSFSVDTPGIAKLIQKPRPPSGDAPPKNEGNVIHLQFGKKK